MEAPAGRWDDEGTVRGVDRVRNHHPSSDHKIYISVNEQISASVVNHSLITSQTTDNVCRINNNGNYSLLGWKISSNNCVEGGRGRTYTGSGPLWRGRRLQPRGPCCKRCRSPIQEDNSGGRVARSPSLSIAMRHAVTGSTIVEKRLSFMTATSRGGGVSGKNE